MSLKSLLTLASGAAALGVIEQSAQAAIWHTAFDTPKTVGFGGGQLTAYEWNLPGTAHISLLRGTGIKTTTESGATMGTNSRRIIAGISGGRFGQQSGARSAANAGMDVALRTNKGKNWTNGSRNGSVASGNIIRSTTSNLIGPGGFSTDKYLLFKFTNTADGNQEQYGWVGMSGATYNAADPTEMSVTFTGWAYDDTGAKIGAGITAVPEVSTGVVSALVAALVVGGVELRRWRKSKPANVSQPG
jgi:hypothetical protein